GGALDQHETALEGALREAAEEVGPPPSDLRVLGEHVFAPALDWTYTTVVVEVGRPFGSPQNFETDAVEWVLCDEVGSRLLHPGFASAWPSLRAIIDQHATTAPA